MRQLSLVLGIAALLVACGDNGGDGPDARPRPDARLTADAPPGTPDADIDAMPGTPDAAIDAAPTPDANPTTSAQIQAAIDASPGTGLNLPITSATVTFIKLPG